VIRPLSLAFVALLLHGCIGKVANAAEVPVHAGHVNDYANVLPTSERIELEKSLAAYEVETTHQVAVLTVPSLHGESIETLSLRVARAWGLGRKGLDNGVLVTLAHSEQAVRIELGTGMSKYVSDAAAQRILEETMLPAFRAGDLRGGLRQGIERLLELCRAYKVSKNDE